MNLEETGLNVAAGECVWRVIFEVWHLSPLSDVFVDTIQNEWRSYHVYRSSDAMVREVM